MKYSEENVVSIKRDIKLSQLELCLLIEEISQRKKELAILNGEKEKARDSVKSIENMAAETFNQKSKDISEFQNKEKNLKETIAKLQFHRGVIMAEIEQAPLPDNRLPYLDSLIKSMKEDLSGVMSEAASKEDEVKKLTKLKAEFEEALVALTEDVTKASQSIEEKQAELDKIDVEREKVLAELVKEKALEAQLRERNNDVATMQYRLTEEYQEVYKRIPSRTNKL